ncbi:MAG: cytochrome b/b6 domain-containing protein [Desulfomonilaceae bacterium]
MKTSASIFTLWKSAIFLVIGAAALILALQYTCVPIMAQETSTSAPQPVETRPKPPESSTQPAQTSQPKQPSAAQPAETPQPKQPSAAKPEATPAPAAQPPATTPPPAAAPTQKPEVKPQPAPKEAAPAQAEEAKSEELTNETCFGCHNPDILTMSKEDLADQVVVEKKPLPARPKPPFIFGKLSLSINQKKYADGVHADNTCVSCHTDVKEVPHNERLKGVDCKECHEDAVESIAVGAHGKSAGPKAPECIGCHDVHYGKSMDAYAKDFARKTCVDCHKASGMNTVAAQHRNLYERRLHLTLKCMICHQGNQPGVHNILPVKTKVARCQSCHTKATILSKEKMKPMGLGQYITQTGFINADSLKKFGYVVGANRIPALDMIIILAVIAPIGLPIVHGGLRFLIRRKGPLHLPEEKILLHPLMERIWHWSQALCIVLLIITGVVLHWPEKFGDSFHWAVRWHNIFGTAAVIAFLFWLIYNLVTGRISHYFPKKGEIPHGLIKQAKFYGYGVFKHEPHPYAPTEDNKFNPLQKIAYLQFQVILLPILLISGILYMYPSTFKGVINAIGGMTVLGIVHLILGAVFAAFLVAHLYLATTGETIGENFKAIIFGYGIKSDHSEHK